MHRIRRIGNRIERILSHEGNLRITQFLKFCLVGGSGVAVDMTILHFLASPQWVGWNANLSKICSAEVAILNNFLWNDMWTFSSRGKKRGLYETAKHLLRFNAICGAGIGMAVFWLHLFYSWLGLNLYLSNLFAILLVTLWNFWVNAVFNWRIDALRERAGSLSNEPENSGRTTILAIPNWRKKDTSAS
jgi:dolichol-phosphate mannosyltransferase